MPLCPYSEASRTALIADAMIAASNRYPGEDVRLLPVFDTLALLLQRPVAFTFFRGRPSGSPEFLWSTLRDPELAASFEPVIRSIGPGAERLIPIPQTSLSLAVHSIRPSVHKGELKAQFPELELKDLTTFKELFDVLHTEKSGLGKTLLKRLGQSLKSFDGQSDITKQTALPACDWAKRLMVVRRLSTTYLTHLIEDVRRIIDGTLEPISGSPLIRASLKGEDFDNLFFVIRSATNETRRRTHFDYTAQLLLSAGQRERVTAAFGGMTASLLEAPLGPGARSIADSVFLCGVADFSDEVTGQGRDMVPSDPTSEDWKRRKAEGKVYREIARERHVFYVPIHVNGVPWLAVFTISPRNNRSATWAHNYSLYRSLINSIAENIRTVAKSSYLQLIKAIFVEEHRQRDKASFVERVNDRWEELQLIFPFPTLRLITPSGQTTADIVEIPDFHTFELKRQENPWFEQQIDFDSMPTEDLFEACRGAISEMQKEDRRIRATLFGHRHSIVNLTPGPLLNAALNQDDSQLAGKARTFVRNAAMVTDVLFATLDFLVSGTHGPLQNKSVASMVQWMQDKETSGVGHGDLRVEEGSDFLPRQDEVEDVFLVLWNLWHNASKMADYGSRSSTFKVAFSREGNNCLITFSQENEWPEEQRQWIAFLNDLGPSPNKEPEPRGLEIVKQSLYRLKWGISADASPVQIRLSAPYP